jgi:hypothetical protein
MKIMRIIKLNSMDLKNNSIRNNNTIVIDSYKIDDNIPQIPLTFLGAFQIN